MTAHNLETVLSYPLIFWMAVAVLIAGMTSAIVISFTPPKR